MVSDQGSSGAFTGQPESHIFDGFLFDVDGTIIDTTEAITKHWKKSEEPASVDMITENSPRIRLQSVTDSKNWPHRLG